MHIASPEEILEFWFEDPPPDLQALMAKARRWFHGSEAFDREVIARFGSTVAAAMNGELDAWSASPRSRLALVIILDQFTRNVFRGTPLTYAGDARAQDLALRSFADGTADQLAFIEQFFLSMPLLHAESLSLQRRETEIAKHLAARAPELYRPMTAMHLEQTAKYLGVIERFGRFPHRNEILGRESTPEELAFLIDWAENAPPAGMRRRAEG
jgi:uncharacterized protein (DUF924 family)